MADLEVGAQGFAFSSGRAAIACVLELVNSGSHVIVQDGLHGGRYRLIEDIRRRSSGLRISYADPADRGALDAAFLPDETKMIWVENPGSPATELAIVADFAREHDLISVCDNSYVTPCLQRPIEHGFTISLHSSPGYLFGGALDDAGIAVIADGQEFMADKLGFLRTALGTALALPSAEAGLRALGSLQVRMDRICDTAERVAAFLAEHPAVSKLRDPGRQARAGGFIAFELDRDHEATRASLSRLQLIRRGGEPTGLASTIEHPADAQFSMVPKEIRAGLGLADGLCRLWIGLEDAEDLIADLRTALG